MQGYICVNVGGACEYFTDSHSVSVARAWVEQFETGTSRTVVVMWDSIREILEDRYGMNRTVDSIQSFWMRTQAQYQK